MGLIERAYERVTCHLENMIRKYESAGDVEKVKKTLPTRETTSIAYST